MGALGLLLAPVSALGPGRQESLELPWELEVSINMWWDNWRKVKIALLEAVGLK